MLQIKQPDIIKQTNKAKTRHSVQLQQVSGLLSKWGQVPTVMRDRLNDLTYLNATKISSLQRAIGNQAVNQQMRVSNLKLIHRQSVHTPQHEANVEDSERATTGLPSFATMWTSYPTGTPEDVKKRIGGQANSNWITNTCAIRMSRSFNYSSTPIPHRHSGLHTIRGGDRMRYAFRVRELKDYLINRYGNPTITHNNPRLEANVPKSMHNKQGILVFTVDGWSDASGHITLWDGSTCIDHCYWAQAKKVELWVAR